MPQRPTIELRSIDRRNPASTWLLEHRRTVTSQSGEDGVVEKIFDLIGTQSKFCVEFGASDGQNLSNSFNLVHNHGWSALLIEPGAQFAKLRELYRDNPAVECVNGFVDFSDEGRLDAHLARCRLPAPAEIDFVSIDIDGNDIYVWEDIKAYRPRVVCIEFNHIIPLDVYFLQPRDMEVQAGSSLLAIAERGRALGYELVSVVGANAIFVDAPLFPKFSIPDNSVEAMHFIGKNETKLIQAFDGTLYLAGLDMNPWKGYRIDEERIQALPSNLRRWKFDGRNWPIRKP